MGTLASDMILLLPILLPMLLIALAGGPINLTLPFVASSTSANFAFCACYKELVYLQGSQTTYLAEKPITRVNGL